MIKILYVMEGEIEDRFILQMQTVFLIQMNRDHMSWPNCSIMLKC